MRFPIFPLAMAMVVLGAFVQPVRAADPPASVAWQGPANAWIASHARRVGGEAPRDKRSTCEGDVNGDGHADVVVIYTIEGIGGGSANDWTQYMTVMTSTPQGFGVTLPKEVGGKSKRAVESCTVAGALVDAVVKEYAPEDASCCPSRPGQAHYAIKNGALVDVPVPAPSGK